jgi:hypothetical protein
MPRHRAVQFLRCPAPLSTHQRQAAPDIVQFFELDPTGGTGAGAGIASAKHAALVWSLIRGAKLSSD